MKGAGSLGVTEVVGAKLECQPSRAFGNETTAYLVLQTCYYDEVLIDTPHVVDGSRVLQSRLCALHATSRIPQPHFSFTATFQDDAWTEPVHSHYFA